jgi:dienelactone hydrolase
MHFFIEHLKLTSQGSSDGFGPSSADPTNKYDVSANFKLESEARAFACQAGHIIVTDFFDVDTGALDPNLVNIILKPMVGLAVPFPPVKYYIYRGIKRTSFFTEGRFNDQGPSNTDTVRKMWEDWNANVTPSNNPLPLAPGDLGFDASLDGTVHIEEIFGNFRAPLRARDVKEGEWIGTFGFSKKICFEVIVEAELLKLDLEYARKSRVQIDVRALTEIPDPTPEQVHALRCEREKILAYLDPAALFGMHFYIGVSGFGLTAKLWVNDLVTTFLSKFSTATRVYLDIRSEKGYSYNFYGNYGGGGASPNLIKIKPGAATAFVDDVYLNHGWPLFSRSGWTLPNVGVNLRLRLRIDDNTKPLLFVEDTGYLGGWPSDEFLDQKDLLDGAALDWSQAINLRLNASGPANGAKVSVATHVRLQYLKQRAGAVMNPRLLQFNHHLDTVFGGINLPGGIGLPIASSAVTFRKLRNDKVGLAEGPHFAHVADTGMYFDPEVVLLYGSSTVPYRTNPKSYPATDFATSTLDNVVRSPVFPSDTVFSRWSIVEGGTTTRLIDLSVYKEGTKNTSVDGIYFLGLHRDELTRLQATTGFGPPHQHQRFLVFEEAADQLDDNGFPYKKYEVKVQGLDAAGQRAVEAPNPAVHVFGAGANMFCSSQFADFVNLPDVPPDPGMMIQWEHIFDGTYKKGDASVDAVEPTGIFTARDIGNDFGSKRPKVKLRARYFFPIDNAGDTTISTRKTSYPLVVIVHGNGQRYTEYDALGKYLAHNGFIVAAVDLFILRSRAKLIPLGSLPNTNYVENSSPVLIIDMPTHQVYQLDPITQSPTLLPMTLGVDFDIHPGPPLEIEFITGPRDFHNLASRGRANVIFKHLEVLKHKFGAKVEDKIGLIGHSRGGEAVVRAPDVIEASDAPADLRKIAAIISLAPTDQYEKENLTKNIPYFVLYGSQDGDVTGLCQDRRLHLRRFQATVHSGSGGFSLYDRASNATVKSMAFVYGASHNGFITQSDRDPMFSKSTVAGSPEVILAYINDQNQKATAIAYMNAFMRQHLLGEAIWRSYFTGEFIPHSTGTNQIFLQYKEMDAANVRTLDDFEDTDIDDWARSSSGEDVLHSRSGAGLDEGFLNPFPPTIDEYSPHETFGLKVAGWVVKDTLTFNVTTNAAGLDVSMFSHLSFRITQVAGGTNSRLDDLKAVVEDTLSHGFPAPLGRTIPDPDPKVLVVFQEAPLPPLTFDSTKSALLTVRIPLATYADNGVDLTKVKLVRFEFPTAGSVSGNIEIDDVEFTK